MTAVIDMAFNDAKEMTKNLGTARLFWTTNGNPKIELDEISGEYCLVSNSIEDYLVSNNHYNVDLEDRDFLINYDIMYTQLLKDYVSNDKKCTWFELFNDAGVSLKNEVYRKNYQNIGVAYIKSDSGMDITTNTKGLKIELNKWYNYTIYKSGNELSYYINKNLEGYKVINGNLGTIKFNKLSLLNNANGDKGTIGKLKNFKLILDPYKMLMNKKDATEVDSDGHKIIVYDNKEDLVGYAFTW